MLKVKLVHDYTKYNEKLEKGLIGFALETPEEQVNRSPSDCFVKVTFDGITSVDVLWRGLDIIDTVYLSDKQATKDAYFSQLKTATNVLVVFGPKGGLRTLEFDFICDGAPCHKFIDDKVLGLEYLTVLEKYNISIEVVQLLKKERVYPKKSS